MKVSSPYERVDQLINYSDYVYQAIDKKIAGESRAKRTMKLGIHIAATSLNSSINSTTLAGNQIHSLIYSEINSAEARNIILHTWPAYETVVEALPRSIPKSEPIDTQLEELAEHYATTTRATKDLYGKNETDDRHSIHLATLALPYAATHYPNLNQAKIALYCLLHDILEGYTGDVPTLTVSPDIIEEKNKREAEALNIFSSTFTARYPLFVQIVHDYESLSDDEAKYVKTFDKLDPGFTHFYNRGSVLVNELGLRSKSDFYEAYDAVTARISAYASTFSLLMDDRDELTRRIAEHTNWPQQ